MNQKEERGMRKHVRLSRQRLKTYYINMTITHPKVLAVPVRP